ncbi:hypothetical protein DUI87_25974 [Hirundo rustica rustica]|uniref:Integrase-type domain-containing protein n=1 Tax=Hirundo rustica rustica TaxID=333673 RepID=A0A3M0JET2_HIRRU|nr:hypothetical protein DUI87_25974 [Hirundo rustica rustica]
MAGPEAALGAGPGLWAGPQRSSAMAPALGLGALLGPRGEKARDVIAHWRQAFAVLGIPSAVKTDSGPAYASQQALDSEQQPRAKVWVRNLVTKQWEEPYDLIAMGRGHACVSMDTGTRWLPSKCMHPDLRPQRQNSADRQGGSRDQLESHQVDESSSVHSDDSSTDSD